MDNWMGWVIMGLCAINFLLLLGLIGFAKAKLDPQPLTAFMGNPVPGGLQHKGATRTTEEPKKKDQSVILMSDARDERILAADQED